MKKSKIRDLIFVVGIIVIQGCGINIFNYVSWSSTDINKLRERECSNNTVMAYSVKNSDEDKKCDCLVNKIRNKYSSLKDLDVALNNPNKAKEYRDFIESEVRNQCNRGSGYPTPTPFQYNN